MIPILGDVAFLDEEDMMYVVMERGDCDLFKMVSSLKYSMHLVQSESDICDEAYRHSHRSLFK